MTDADVQLVCSIGTIPAWQLMGSACATPAWFHGLFERAILRATCTGEDRALRFMYRFFALFFLNPCCVLGLSRARLCLYFICGGIGTRPQQKKKTKVFFLLQCTVLFSTRLFNTPVVREARQQQKKGSSDRSTRGM